MTKEDEWFTLLRRKFPRISEAKKNEGIFVDPQVRKLFQDTDFRNHFNSAEKISSETFMYAATSWEITKSENYVEILEKLLFSYCVLGCNMSLKLHFLLSHLDFFFREIGGRLWRARWKVPSGYIPNCKIQQQMEPKHAGWLLLDSCTGDTNRRIHEKKKMSFSWYTYLFLLSVL
jgi:hypothetical protein